MDATGKDRENSDQEQPKRHIRNFLLDKRFQLRWVFRVVLATLVIVLIMGYFLYQTVSDATDQLLAQKLGDQNLTQEAVEAFVEQNEKDKMVTIGKLAAWLFALVVMLSGFTIALTHRVAGPVFKIRRIFASIGGDNLKLWDRLRRGDELQEAFGDFDEMVQRLREDRRRDTEELEAILMLIKSGDKQGESAAKLETLLTKYRASVKMD